MMKFWPARQPAMGTLRPAAGWWRPRSIPTNPPWMERLRGGTWDNHGNWYLKTMGKLWKMMENHGKTMEKRWKMMENDGTWWKKHGNYGKWWTNHRKWWETQRISHDLWNLISVNIDVHTIRFPQCLKMTKPYQWIGWNNEGTTMVNLLSLGENILTNSRFFCRFSFEPLLVAAWLLENVWLTRSDSWRPDRLRSFPVWLPDFAKNGFNF